MLEEIFEKLNIKYDFVKHKAVYTVAEIKKLDLNIKGVGCKNLFLTAQKDKYYLVVLPEDKRADFKELNRIVHGHLTFASEEDLLIILGLKRGSCTPLGIMNDNDKKTILLLDKELEGKRLLLHPNRNTATIAIEFSDLIKFINYFGNEYQII